MSIKYMCSELLDIPESQISTANFLLDPKTPQIYFMDAAGRVVGDKDLLEQFLDLDMLTLKISSGFTFNRKVYIIHLVSAGKIQGILEVRSYISAEDKRTKAYLKAISNDFSGKPN